MRTEKRKRKITKKSFWKHLTETSKINETIIDSTEKDTLLDFSLARITFLNQIEKKKLKNAIDSADSLALLSIEEISCLIGRDIGSKADWKGKQNFLDAKREYAVCKKMNIGFLRYDDADYPVLLKEIYNPPYMIFYRGSLAAFKQKSVSVVGTRRITAGGKQAAIEFGKAAALDGVAVISGLANGVDGFSHKGAVDAYFDYFECDKDTSNLGKTVAVLPCGIDSITPRTHVKLAENILRSGGCLISEYPPLTEMANWHFVKRNRIIAALSPATVVIEAPNGSGALITADFALELNRDVMFHEACFSENAKKIKEFVKSDLEQKVREGQKSKHKLETCPEQYVSDGAPVIKNYEDYCRCLKEAPGSRTEFVLRG